MTLRQLLHVFGVDDETIDHTAKAIDRVVRDVRAVAKAIERGLQLLTSAALAIGAALLADAEDRARLAAHENYEVASDELTKCARKCLVKWGAYTPFLLEEAVGEAWLWWLEHPDRELRTAATHGAGRARDLAGRRKRRFGKPIALIPLLETS
jgi:hypothetical protein